MCYYLNVQLGVQRVKVLTKAGQWNAFILSYNLNLPNSIFLLGYPSTNFICIYPLYHAYLRNFDYIDQGGASAVIIQTCILNISESDPCKLVAILRPLEKLLFPDKESNTLKHAQIATNLHLLILVICHSLVRKLQI